MINKEYPHLKNECEIILRKNRLSALDVIALSKIISGKVNNKSHSENQKHRAYDKNSIIKILDYGQKQKLNNIHLARHFKISRNTVAKWKRKFSDYKIQA